jgi:uncharacterized protein
MQASDEVSHTEAPSCRILSLDGGGAKGFYSIGVLRELEALVGRPLHQHFDLIFGTSTGSIIAALLALGNSVERIHTLYRENVTKVMAVKSVDDKTRALAALAVDVFGSDGFDTFKTGIGIVATRWVNERPMIFKGALNQAHGRTATFVPGFGCTIADAVQASCSAFPFFDRKIVEASTGDRVELIDGGYCANNPTLYAIADATAALGFAHSQVRVVSIGVGAYPQPKPALWSKTWFAQRLLSVELLQKTMEINTQSMDQLRSVLFRNVATIRISDTFSQPEMATDLFEHNLIKLNILHQRGRESFAPREADLRSLLL